jgi:hypothetical protein
MVQVPTPTMVAVLPDTVQMPVVLDVNVMAKPEPALALKPTLLP